MGFGRLVILSGPSGVGKDTVIGAWRRADSAVEQVVAYTTREPRTGEVDGIDYHFVSVDEFQRKVAAGDFLEHKRVVDNYYATPIDQTERILGGGRIAVLKIDVQGAEEVRRRRPDAISIILVPPTLEHLRKRMLERKTDSPEVIERRMAEAANEIAQAPRYQHQIVNGDGDVDKVVAKLQELTAR